MTSPIVPNQAIQADRDHAQHFVIVPENQRKIRDGEMDWSPAVQAFAAHRLSSTADLQDRCDALRDALEACVFYIGSPFRMSTDDAERERRSRLLDKAHAALTEAPAPSEGMGNGELK